MQHIQVVHPHPSVVRGDRPRTTTTRSMRGGDQQPDGSFMWTTLSRGTRVPAGSTERTVSPPSAPSRVARLQGASTSRRAGDQEKVRWFSEASLGPPRLERRRLSGVQLYQGCGWGGGAGGARQGHPKEASFGPQHSAMVVCVLSQPRQQRRGEGVEVLTIDYTLAPLSAPRLTIRVGLASDMAHRGSVLRKVTM